MLRECSGNFHCFRVDDAKKWGLAKYTQVRAELATH